MQCPTVRIKSDIHPDGVIINESDFDEDKHELQEGKKMGIADMRALLTERGIAFPEGAKKADLQALIDAAN